MTFLMPSGTYHNPNVKHLFIVCTDMDENGNVLLASVSSWKNRLCDPTCKLAAGCHEFITKDSYVMYRKSRVEAAATIDKGIRTGVFVQKDDVGKHLIQAALDGFCASKQTPRKIKRYVESLNQ